MQRKKYNQVSVQRFAVLAIVFVHCLFGVLLRYVFIAFIQRSISKVDLFLLRQVPNDYCYRTLNVEVEGH